MRLSQAAYKWALRHLEKEGDSDLFPTPIEVAALRFNWTRHVLPRLASLDLQNYAWKGGKRFVVPKDVLAFRIGTQLEPVDSLVLAALVKSVGKKLERHRAPEDTVFSYRFAPTTDGLFYGQETGWHAFWRRSCELAHAPGCTHVLVADIADFYNQIYHHVVENQLADAGLSGDEVRLFRRFLSANSETVSRGIPVGPHSVHLLAELSLNPIDQDLRAKGLTFCRYVDDFHVFCGSEVEAVGAHCDLANSLDSQQRLMLSRGKTQVLSASAFVELAENMLTDRPATEEEAEVLEVIGKHVGGDPYAIVALDELSDEDLEELRPEVLEELLSVYLSSAPTNFARLGWLYRRLRQIGVPGAIDYSVDHLHLLAPIAGDVARYIMAAAPNYEGDPRRLGERIIAQFGLPFVAKVPYLQVIFLDVLASVPALNHARAVTARYDASPPEVRREILKVAAANQEGSWIRGRKHEFRSMDPWLRRAYLLGLPSMPGDEAGHWLRSIRRDLLPLERLVVRLAFRDQTMNLGPGTDSVV